MSKTFSLSQMNKITINGTVRTYNLILPPDPSKKSALIIALHGFAGNAKTIERISNLNEYAHTYNLFIAYPNGFGTATSVMYSWNAKFCCGNAYNSNSDDVRFIKQLIEELKIKYKAINESKIIITGISNGAMMTNRLGMELGELINGIVLVAGAIGTKFPNQFSFEISSTPLDVLIFHGLKDALIPYEGGIGSFSKKNFLPAIEQVHYWNLVNNCDPIPIKEFLANDQVIKESYTSSTTGKKVTFYSILEGTHTWPGGIKGVLAAGEPVSKEICDASQIIVDYFMLDKD